MSRWFRHYAGLCRDEKLVSVALKSKQPIERVVWVWCAILESAAEVENNGRYRIDADEIAYFLRANAADILAVIDGMSGRGLVADDTVVNWRGGGSDNARPPANEWRIIRERIFVRDDFTCVYCGARGARLECDHVVPVTRGGPSTDDNLATACKPCNQSKRDKLLSEWRQ